MLPGDLEPTWREENYNKIITGRHLASNFKLLRGLYHPY
jgi:hypothetical protein